MNLLVQGSVINTLFQELKSAGRREIGGVLVGEHLGEDRFRLVDISVQRDHGDSHHFVRNPSEHRAFLADFFEKSGHDYTRYNYLGEWHSHPNAAALPSTVDVETMRQIVTDPAVDAAFAVLLIARWSFWRGLELSACSFLPHAAPRPVSLAPDHESSRGQGFREVKSRPRRHFIRI